MSEFKSKEWSSDNPVTRSFMVGFLARSQKLIGMSTPSIASLLGAPDRVIPECGTSWRRSRPDEESPDIPKDGTIQYDFGVHSLEFALKNGGVQKYRITTDVYGLKGDSYPVSQKTADYGFRLKALDGRVCR